jgi:hypothetical protein
MRFREQSRESEEDYGPFMTARTQRFDQRYVQGLIVDAERRVGEKAKNGRGQRNKWKRKKVGREKVKKSELRVFKNGNLKRTQSPDTCLSEIAIVILTDKIQKS